MQLVQMVMWILLGFLLNLKYNICNIKLSAIPLPPHRFLIQKGADKNNKNEDGERPIDLVDSSDFAMIKVVLE